MRVAIFGGTFDPVHNAHLAVARAAVRAFDLDRVLMIPAANPPHKRGRNGAGYEDRYRMVELACGGDARLAPSRMEQGAERSYSVLTIERLRRENPDDRFFFLIGADAFAEIRTWHRWHDVIGMVEFIVVTRPGHHFEAPEGCSVHTLESVSMAVSSSKIRDQLRAGQGPCELPPAVLEYIKEKNLYRPEAVE